MFNYYNTRSYTTEIFIYSHLDYQRRCVNIQINQLTTFQTIRIQLISKLFQIITELRLFNTEGVEVYQEDLPFLKEGQILHATNFGQEFNPQQILSQYEIHAKLGQGGFGEVLLAVNKLDQTKVAIKLLDTTKISNAEDIEMIFREAETLKSLKHKNIVQVYNSFTMLSMKVVFIMEYCAGGELLEYLENYGTMNEKQAKDIFWQLADGIQYCHQQKVIHRDLKLENVLFKDKSYKTVKIIDFGIAGISNNLNVDKINAGSLQYMPPEILSGKQHKITPMIDIWALGVILYAIVRQQIFGHLPFSGQSAQEVLESIQNVFYHKNLLPFQQLSLPTMETSLCDLLSLIFIQDPNKRIKLNLILNHHWFNDEKEIGQSK